MFPDFSLCRFTETSTDLPRTASRKWIISSGHSEEDTEHIRGPRFPPEFRRSQSVRKLNVLKRQFYIHRKHYRTSVVWWKNCETRNAVQWGPKSRMNESKKVQEESHVLSTSLLIPGRVGFALFKMPSSILRIFFCSPTASSPLSPLWPPVPLSSPSDNRRIMYTIKLADHKGLIFQLYMCCMCTLYGKWHDFDMHIGGRITALASAIFAGPMFDRCAGSEKDS